MTEVVRKTILIPDETVRFVASLFGNKDRHEGRKGDRAEVARDHAEHGGEHQRPQPYARDMTEGAVRGHSLEGQSDCEESE